MNSLWKSSLLLLSMMVLPLATNPVLGADEESEDTSKTSTGKYGVYWIGNFSGSPTGCVYVKLNMITSVSIHNYMLNGKIPISELTIDTTGNNSIRIYSFLAGDDMSKEMLSMVNQLKSEAQSAGSVPQVAKQFPEGTHSHSIEYCVSSSNQLKTIYNSIIKAMTTNKTTTLTIKQ